MNVGHIEVLRKMLAAERGVLKIGAPNAFAARIIADVGFKAIYLTGAGLNNMHLGLPDLGFMDLTQVVGFTMAIHGIGNSRSTGTIC
jgi:2-methylisocitrate lyase-like PEP mutase family enzyme